MITSAQESDEKTRQSTVMVLITLIVFDN